MVSIVIHCSLFKEVNNSYYYLKYCLHYNWCKRDTCNTIIARALVLHSCHSLFCLWVVYPLQCRSSILVFILFIYVIYVTNHQNHCKLNTNQSINHCKCKMQMSVIMCSRGLLDWFNKTILFYSVRVYPGFLLFSPHQR
jgi:hypothetical protein